MMSSKIMNRTGDKGQPCLPDCTCTGNSSDLGPTMWTLAFSRGPLTPEAPPTGYQGKHPKDHHSGLSNQRHSPQMPWFNTEACHPRQPCNIQRFEVLMDLIHPQYLATTSAISSWVINKSASHHLVPLWKEHQQDQRDPRSIPSTTWRCPCLRSTVPHFHCKKCWWTSARPSCIPPRPPLSFPRPKDWLPWLLALPYVHPQANSAQLDFFFILTASLTSSVYHRVRGVPPWPILETLQLQTALPPMEVESMVHLDLMSPASLQDLVKVLLEVVVEDLPVREFHHLFSTHPHNRFGSFRSFHLLTLPADPT